MSTYTNKGRRRIAVKFPYENISPPQPSSFSSIYSPRCGICHASGYNYHAWYNCPKNCYYLSSQSGLDETIRS
jgi:hypothetical protein